ncbi:hypothetical protein HaLaN_27013 [Haematococcus lacustris]|uniref:Uncharacterized protein n=1 Tax=Haematococcus lacustris TaxID=44745 RepID=A0A6A0A7B2_HAELA|nr:hypothetical protein HaLaN_27013 [Haematococcus lacustris]
MALSFATQRSVPQRTPTSFAPRVRRVLLQRDTGRPVPLHRVRCFSEVSAQGHDTQFAVAAATNPRCSAKRQLGTRPQQQPQQAGWSG